jgi:hypothetical protein
MGWLFAVALGLQEKNRRAVLGALLPIALGHVISVSGIVVLVAVAQETLPANALRYGAAAILIAFGIYRAVRARHFRWVGMRVGFWGLTAWSLLMATGHGAGLMLIPLLTGASDGGIHAVTMQTMGGMGAGTLTHVSATLWAWAVAVHTFGYLATMTIVALLIYDKVGVQILRTAWFNFDLAWALALVVSGVLMLVL